MKNIFAIFLVIGLLGFFGWYFSTLSPSVKKQLPPVASQTAISPTETYCSPHDLQATLALDAGAGNIYGTATLKNISDKICQIIGNNFLSAVYDQAIKNIAVTHIGQPEKNVFELAPNQTIYSQVHYPNGPQCGGGVKTAQVTFTYAISSAETITFTNENGKNEQDVTICTDPSEMTTIQVWNMSLQQITQ